MSKFFIALIVVAGVAGTFAMQQYSLRDIRAELTALRAASGQPAPVATADTSRRPAARAERVVTMADPALEQRLVALEETVNRLAGAADMLMERGQLPLSEAKAREMREKFLNAGLPDNERMQALRLLRRNNAVTDEVAMGALAWIQSSTNAQTARTLLDQFDGLTHELMKAPLMQFATSHADIRVRQQAVENLGHYASDPAVSALLWQSLNDPEESVRREAANSLRNVPVTEANMADLRLRAMNSATSLDERLTAFQSLARSRADVSDLAASMAAAAQTAQNAGDRARIFAAFDGMNNPALAAPLVGGLQDPDPGVRRAAADSLRALGNDPAIAEWLRYVAENDNDPRVRREAMQSLRGANQQQRR